MAKTKISEFSTTPGNNTDINGINIAEGCAPSGINNAIRELMSDLKEWQSGAMDVYVIPQGTAAAPGIQLYGDLDTGLYGYAANQLGVAVGGASAGYFSSAGWVGNVVATTVDLTNIEVTNIKAKDGTTSISLADSTGIATFSKATVIETTDNTNAALRITQLGTGNALLVEDATNPDTTPTVIDQFGNVILGTTTRTTPVTSKIEIHGTASELSGLSPSLGFYHWSATASLSSTLTFRHYPSGTVGTLAANTSGDVLGRIVFLSYDGTNAFSASIRGVSGAGGTAPSITYDASGGHNFTSGPIDVENLEVTNIKARDGTAAASIADSTGVMTIASSVLTTTDINGGTIDGTTIGGSTAAAGTFTTATATTGNITTVNATTVDTTNLEVTNIKAKDGTAALSIADSTGAVTVATAFAANGGATLGDASGDALTINSSAVSTPNGLNFDSDTFVIDATNNRVGINNASPTVALDVTGALTISGNAILGDASTDTVQVNGYMGVGGAASGAYNILARGSTTSGSNQYSIGSTAVLSGTTNSAAFLAGNSIADSVAVTNASGARILNVTLGTSASITSQHGIRIEDLTSGTNNFGITSLVSSGTNKWNIYASGTAANYFAGNVGIGTSSPQSVLHAVGSASASTPIARIATSTGPYVGIGSEGTNYSWVQGFGSKPLYINPLGNNTVIGLAGGNLGLGVTPSAWGSTYKAITVTGAGSYVASNGNQRIEVGTNSYVGSDDLTRYYVETAAATYYRQVIGQHNWYTAPSGTAGNAITFTERAKITATEMVVNEPGEDYDFRVESDTNTHALFVDAGNGRVGINESAPDATLSVNGVIQALAPSATTIANGATATVITPNRGFSYINVSRSDTAAFGLLLLVFRTTSTLEIVSTVSDKTSASYSASVSGTGLQITNSSGSEKAFYASAVCIAFGTGD